MFKSSSRDVTAQLQEVPDDSAIDENTIEGEVTEQRGEDTLELSDISDDENSKRHNTATHSRSKFIRVFHHVRPLLRDRRVLVFSIFNVILFVLCLLLLIAIVGLLVFFAIYRVEYVRRSYEDKPCYYEWSTWGECSATCYSGNGDLPKRSRSVIAGTVVLARGKYANPRDKCPDDVETMLDYAPCNTYKCPRKLSNITYGACYPKNLDNPDDVNNCYKVLDIKEEDALIEIDFANITKDCKCEPYDMVL